METYYAQLRKTPHKVRGHQALSMKEEMAIFQTLDGDLMPDVYGQGKIIEDFQNLLCDVTGKPSAVFFPSGTMAQQIALRIVCDEKGLNQVAYHPLCHLEIHEQDGLKKLHLIKSVLLGEADRLFTLEDLKNMPQVSAVLFELPQREIGGQLPSWSALIEMIDYCKNNQIHTHLDGARLFECLPYYEKTAKEVCDLFDSVYISFYKGIGGVTGAMLLGEKAFMETSKVWKRRHGGDLYHLYPYIVTALNGFEKRLDWMGVYYEQAKSYAKLLSEVEGVKIVPERPVTNMFHVYFQGSAETLMRELTQVMVEEGIALMGHIGAVDENTCKTELWIGDQYGTIDQSIILKGIEKFKAIRKSR